MELMLAMASEKPEAPVVSKTTVNYAAKRGIELTVEESKNSTELWIWDANEESEPLCIYIGQPSGWHFKGNIYLPQSVKEEMPAWIKDDKMLRKVIDFLKTYVQGQ